jgi:hypothetical protein
MDFYKIQSRHTKGGRSILQAGPWKVLSVYSYAPGSRLPPWKEIKVSNVVQGQGGGAARRIPATSPATLTGEVAGEGLVVVGNRLGCLLTAERQPAVGCGGGWWRRPLGALLRRACSSAWPTSGRGSFACARGRREQHVSAVKSGRRWSSP